MGSQYVTTDSFRQNIVNRRSIPADLTELLTDFRPLVTEQNQVIQWYVILNECIYNNDISDFKITYTLNEQEIILVKDDDYTLDTTSAVVVFKQYLDPHNLNNLTAKYTGGGSIVWAEDVTDLQKVVKVMDTNTVYTNGNNYMTGDLYLGTGTQANPYHNIKNVNTVDGIKLSTHNHTGNQNGALIPAQGIENNAIVESKIATNAVTNSKINTGSVTNDKVAENTLTANKFSSIMIGSGLKRVSTTINGVNVNNAILQTNVDDKTITYNNGALQVPAIINLTGVVLPYAGSGTSVPPGWLLCDGSSYSTSQYYELFQVIGHTYGGSGSTFKVPNFVGKTFWGGVNNNGIEHQEIAPGLPNIAGFIDGERNDWHGGAFTYWKNDGRAGNNGEGNLNAYYFNASDGECGTTKADNPKYENKVYGKSDTVQPPAIRMKFIIKT